MNNDTIDNIRAHTYVRFSFSQLSPLNETLDNNSTVPYRNNIMLIALMRKISDDFYMTG